MGTDVLNRASQRREAAVEAARRLAESLGILSASPRVLKDWNNTIVHLAPAPVVAKVGTSHFREARREPLERELQVSRHLASKGAPIVQPSSDFRPGPYYINGLTLTLWRYYEEARATSASFAPLLKAVHDGLRDYRGPLPWFGAELQDAGRVLQDRPRLARLADGDYDLLVSVHRELTAAVGALPPDEHRLHGSPHSGNWLFDRSGPLLHDFETACRGPLEWDVSALPDEAVAAFPSVDRARLALLRRVRSLCVAVWCWIEPDRAPELAEAAELHLRLLRGETIPET